MTGIKDNHCSEIRGGGKTEDEETKEERIEDLNNKEVRKIIEKISGYKEKVLNDKALNSELALFVEPMGEFTDTDNNPETDPFELTYGIQKYLLES